MPPRPIIKPKCHTCRRRRKQCDYAKPSCGQCVKSGRTCEGYDRDIVFVHAQDQVKIPRRRRKNQDGEEPDQEQESDWNKTQDFQQPRQHILPPKRTAKTQPSLTRSLYAGELHGDMLLDMFIGYLAPQNSLDDNVAVRWFENLPQARRRFPPLDQAIKALSIMALGRGKELKRAPVDAYALYGQAMAGLRNWHINYKNLERTCWPEALMTSMVFQFYETFDHEAPPETGFHNHFDGMTVLIKNGGDEIVTDPKFRSLLSFCRVSLWTRGVLGGSEPIRKAEWCRATWGPRLEAELQYALDALMPIPLLLDEARRLTKEQHTWHEFELFQSALRKVMKDLSQWEKDSVVRTGQPLYGYGETYPSRSTSPAGSPPELSRSPGSPSSTSSSWIPRGIDINFRTAGDAVVMMLFWSAHVLSYSSAMKMYEASPWATPADKHRGPLPTTGISGREPAPVSWETAASAADNIRHSIPYLYSRDASGLGGVQLSILPLMALRQFYKNYVPSMDGYNEAMASYMMALRELVPSLPAGDGNIMGQDSVDDVRSRYGLWYSMPMVDLDEA